MRVINVSAAVLSCIALAACAQSKRTFLINAATSSPLVEIAVPPSDVQCAATSLHVSVSAANAVQVEACNGGQCREAPLADLTFRDRSTRVGADKIALGSGSAEGDVEPVVGPDDLLWLCREDEEAQECICIPWAQD
jgi:hypothetical protein